jgi:hypothetical protein
MEISISWNSRTLHLPSSHPRSASEAMGGEDRGSFRKTGETTQWGKRSPTAIARSGMTGA